MGAELPESDWDVFLSYPRSAEATVAALERTLCGAGLRVFRDVGVVEPFTSISEATMAGLRSSKLVLAYHSAEYPTRPACQLEFASAYLAGQAEGDPLRRLLVINPEASFGHVQPVHVRDALLPAQPVSAAGMRTVVDAVRAQVDALHGGIGEPAAEAIRWRSGQPVYPPSPFIGRWPELWWLHSALHADSAPLTTEPSAPVAVLYGVAGIGKTALAAEYLRRFGATFPGGVRWHAAPDVPGMGDARDGRCLLVVEDTDGDVERLRATLPTDAAHRALVLTRNPEAAALGNALGVGDLADADAQVLVVLHGGKECNARPQLVPQLASAAEGSPELRIALAKLADTLSLGAMDRLHEPHNRLLAPVRERLSAALGTVDETARDVLRALVAAAPAACSPTLLANALGGDRLTTIAPVHAALRDLLAAGLLPGTPQTEEFTLPSAFTLALRDLERQPARAERIRAAMVRTLAARTDHVRAREAGPRGVYDDVERRAAAAVQTEVLTRVSGWELPDDQGSLREALASLYRLLKTIRKIVRRTDPLAQRVSTATRPGFGTVAARLIELLREFLLDWHIPLREHEQARPADIGAVAHERSWPHAGALRTRLRALRVDALDCVAELSVISGSSLGLPVPPNPR